MLTRAAVLNRTGLDGIDLTIVQLDSPRDHEVLVRVSASGLCHSDLHVINGTLAVTGARILGHEISGVVEEVGDRVTSVAPGDHVVACLAMACGECERCASDQPNLCSRRGELWSRPADETPRAASQDGSPVATGSGIGGLAERALVDERGLVAIPAWMPLTPAALLGCGVLAGTGAVFRSAGVAAGDSVAVIGCGGVGMSIIQAARIAGAARVIAVDRFADKLTYAKRFGATDAVLAVDNGGHLGEIRDLSGGGVNHAFEAVGTARTVEDALATLAPRGLATLVGVFAAGVDIRVPAREMLTKETRLQGSYMGSSVFRRDILELCRLYRSGDLLLDEMIEPRLALDEVRHGFGLLARGAALRPLVLFDGR
jgi:S-(hydroxymethyl)glutathione dehydrogenase / alcohol dehydrogenase